MKLPQFTRVPAQEGSPERFVGGFVFQQVHNILANVPAQNLIAMYDAVREYNTLAANPAPALTV